jgi:hypothetical protein
MSDEFAEEVLKPENIYKRAEKFEGEINVKTV